MITNFFEIYNSLPESFRKKSILFVFFLLITTVLELFGIGLVIPIIDLLSSSKSETLAKLTFLDKYLDLTDTTNLLWYALVAFLSIYILKSLVLVLFYFWRNKFIWNAYRSISTTILKQYISKSIDFYFKTNSTELINTTYLESRNYISCLNEYLKIISEGVILFAIFIFLLIYDTKSILIVGVLISISSILIRYFTKERVKKLGEVRLKASIGQLKNLQQIFFSIKDIKLKSLEFNFFEKYNRVIKDYSKSAYLAGSIIELPKIFFEIMFILSISLIILVLSMKGLNEGNIVTNIGVYAVASFRAFPCVTRIIQSVQQISFLKPSINKVLPNLQNKDNKKLVQEIKFKKLEFLDEIEIDNISYTYPRKSTPVVRNFSLSIKKGDFIGIAGKSGRGKSTILDLLMGLIKPSTGKILVDGNDIQKNLKNWQAGLGYVSQSTNLLDDTIKNNIAFGIPDSEIEEGKLYESAKNSQILEFINSLKDKFETPVGERGIAISGGQIQRIGIARELYRDPSIILLDESTSSLDLETEKEFLKCLNQLKGKKTIIFVSHRRSALENCNKIIELDNYDQK